MQRRSDCPISFGLDLFGDRWTLLVVRDLALYDKHTFSELAASDEHIATNVLTDRLERLLSAGVIRKERDPNDGRRRVYRLTEKGVDLIPVLVEIILWSAEHDPHTRIADGEFVAEAKRDRRRLLARLRRKAGVA